MAFLFQFRNEGNETIEMRQTSNTAPELAFAVFGRASDYTVRIGQDTVTMPGGDWLYLLKAFETAIHMRGA